ncbi:hypothetical protein EDD21DRAFT_207789 [Dissophora ornata]|nr:hypothetical protein EDD21DRAFT_207789 [Dissophora ornata]
MEEYLSSSEAFAKALKGFHVSPEEKIHLAKEAWHRSDVVLPHKQEFLLEWLCSTLVKSSIPSKNPKDTPTNIILDQEYWDLFKDVLSELTYSRKNSRKYTRLDDDLCGSGSQFGASQALGVLLRVPVIPVFMALIEKLSHRPLAVAFQVESTKSGKKTKAAVAPVPIHDPTTETPSITVLEAASTCFGLLSSPLMSEWFQPTLEQYTPLVQTTLEALVDVAQESSNVSSKKQQIVTNLAHMVLDRFKRLIVIQPNQKKVFALVAGRMFEALVRARVAICNDPGASAVECQEALGAILKTGLFHQDHLPEYTAGYIAGDEKSVQSYQKQLFEQIATLIKSEHSTAVLDILPLLLRLFVEESRKRQRGLAINGFDRGTDSARETEFSFFKIIYVLAKKQLPQIAGEPSEASLKDLANVMEAHNHLLTTILQLNMYQPSNDETADQFVFMSTSFGSIYSCLRSAQTLSNGRLQSTSLTGIVVLAQLDDRLLKPHLDSLWPVLFCPLHGAEGAVLDLAKTLLEIYGKASDLKIFLNSLFASLRQHLSRPLDLASSPIFSQTFLDLIPVNIKSYLPLPQAPDILDIFVTELLAIDSTMEIAGLEPVQEFTRKKRKLNSGRGEDHESINVPSAEPIISLLIQFLKGLRITVNQEKHLNKEFRIVYEQFLERIFVDLAGESSNVKKSEYYQTRRLTPALKLHYAVCKISTQYWTNGVSTALMEKVVATFKRTSGWTDATILMLNRVVLQHVHMTLCSADNMDDELLQHCKDLVSFTMESSQLKRLLNDSSLMLEPWNGRLESASGNAFLVASWQIQVNDWLDIVCRFGMKQHMELIAQVIARQFSTPSASETTATLAGSITIQLLNQILLRSANFYEVPNFRPIFAQTILQHLSASIEALSGTDLERKLATIVSSFTAGESLKESANKATFSDALKELAAASNQHSGTRAVKTKVKSNSRAAEEHGPRILSLLSILHLLPLEYFEKYERNIILTTMAVLEHYIQHYLVADPTGVKCLLLERRISNDIMTWRSDAGVLFNDPSLLRNVIDYPSWNCSTAYGIEDKDGLGQAIMDATCSMILHGTDA